MRFIMLFCFCMWSFSQAKAQLLVVPDSLQPSLTFVRQELETQIKEAKSQKTVLRLTNRLPEIAGAELFFAYVHLYERSSPVARVALRREQKQWDKTSDAYALDHIYTGDSAVVVAGLRDIIHYTDLRTEKLRQRLSYLQRHRSRSNSNCDN